MHSLNIYAWPKSPFVRSWGTFRKWLFEFPFLALLEPDGAPLLCFSSDTESLRFGFSHPTILAVELSFESPLCPPLVDDIESRHSLLTHNHPTAILVTFIIRNIPILRSE